jgi:lipopolysaccharide transport system permease protein
MLRAAWHYRGFILGSVRREFRSRYGGTLLGSAWALIQPLALIVVYAVIFSQVMTSRLPGVDSSFGYSIYLCAGILTWGLFAEIATRGQTMFIEQANLLKKSSFPRICVPLIVLIGALLNFAIVFALFTGFLAVTGSFPGPVFLAVIPVLAIQILFAMGLGLVLGVLNVFFRDVGQFFGVFVQFWFWLTPIVYPLSILPAPLRRVVERNPLAVTATAFQDILVHARQPDWLALAFPLGLGLLLCAGGVALFRRRAGEIADEL